MTRRRQRLRRLSLDDDTPGLFDLLPDSGDAEPLSAPKPADVDDSTLRFISFGSGSSGNCAYIGTPACGLLIDGGVDNNYVMQQLALNGIDPLTIRGILLTHDHYDHMRYVYAILRRNMHMRLFATPKMMKGLLMRHNTSKRIIDYHQPVYKEFTVDLGALRFTPFETSHDGSDNVGYAITAGDVNFCVTTDTGYVTSRADFYMRTAHYLMLESDYDAEMLRNGPYAGYLKARILSDMGHLDNADTGRYLAYLAPLGLLRRVFLCHLSDINNTPERALATIWGILEAAGIDVNRAAEPLPRDPRLHIAPLPRKQSSPLFFLR